MRVLFLSDTHLGLDLPWRPRVTRRRRGHDFFANFDRALEPARRGEADVVVHGGDLLYRSRVPASLVDLALAPLKRVAASGVPVLLVPGNHERGQLPCPLLALHEGLHVFDRPRTVRLEARGVRVAFIGFPYTPRIGHRFADVFAAAKSEAEETDVRVLCMHQLIEGATCGPGDFTFRFGPDTIRATDLPGCVAATLCGHIHRHQVLRPAHGSPVIYAGSIERTSFAEEPETKGYVMLDLTRSGVGGFEFRQLPARPMVTRDVSLVAASPSDALDRVALAIESTPEDAVVRLRVTGVVPSTVSSAVLRRLAGARNVTLALRAGRPRPRAFTSSLPSSTA